MNKKDQNREIECKVLDIDVEAIRKKLRELGAQEFEEKLMRRWVFDINPQNSEFIRLRDENGKVTLTYKYRRTYEIGDTEEIEVEVSDFEQTAKIFHKLKVKDVYYQENRRQIFLLAGIEFAIDTWPNIPTYLEIESDSLEKVQEGLKLLGLEGKDIGSIPTKEVYDLYGIDLHSFPELKF